MSRNNLSKYNIERQAFVVSIGRHYVFDWTTRSEPSPNEPFGLCIRMQREGRDVIDARSIFYKYAEELSRPYDIEPLAVSTGPELDKL